MKNKVVLVEMLIEKVEELGKTNLELYKLHAIDKSTDVFASLTTRLVLLSCIALFFFLITIGLSLYIGDLIGKTYYGFFAMAVFYAFIFMLLMLFKNKLETIFNNYLIVQIFKEKKSATN